MSVFMLSITIFTAAVICSRPKRLKKQFIQQNCFIQNTLQKVYETKTYIRERTLKKT